MINQTININSKELVILANKLEKLHKSALPVAVRMTLNDAAFDMKQKQVIKTFESRFTIRKRNFIRSHTTVIKSPNSFRFSQMVAVAGVIAGKSKAGDQLINQEFGGRINNRDYIPTKGARVSGSESKLVTRKYYLKNIKPKKAGVRRNQSFIKAAFAVGKGGFIRYDNLLIEIRGIRKTKGGLKFNTKVVYSFRKGRSVKIKRRPFLKPAGDMTANRIPDIFYKNAQKRFEKYMKI